jgi:hypothetical protein
MPEEEDSNFLVVSGATSSYGYSRDKRLWIASD